MDGSHSIVDPDRGKPDGNPRRKEVWFDVGLALGWIVADPSGLVVDARY